jgi:hypothetical protein
MFKPEATRTLIAQIKILFRELFPSASNSFAGVFLLVSACGCLITPRPLPPANLADTAWTVRLGQAVWTLPNSGHDLAGDLVVATAPGGKSFVQFSKSPFPLVIGQTEANRWQVEFPAENKRYGGPGSPPKRLIWLYLPRVLTGKPPPPHWTWKYSDGNWRLENGATGEALEGFFAQ